MALKYEMATVSERAECGYGAAYDAGMETVMSHEHTEPEHDAHAPSTSNEYERSEMATAEPGTTAPLVMGVESASSSMSGGGIGSHSQQQQGQAEVVPGD